MIVRRIRPEEYKRTVEIGTHAFEYPMDDWNVSAQEMAEQMDRHPQDTEDVYWKSHWAAFQDDDRTMMSSMDAIPYRMHFDGQETLMIGIGGVATLPQYRRCGGVRGCFEAALPDMYAQGAVFSYLYPFSTAFYRKFGYELGCERDRYTIQLAGVPEMEAGGHCDLLEPGKNMKEDIRSIDLAWVRRYNCMVRDIDVEYEWIDKANPFRDVVYTYVYYDAQGTPKGYMTFKTGRDMEKIDCKRFLFVDREGLGGLMNLLRTMASRHALVTLCLPTDVELGGLLPEWSLDRIECSREQAGMVRVVNVEAALRMAKMRGTGSLTIEIKDGQIAPNNGRFTVCYEAGRTTGVVRTDAPCDISMPVEAFSRLICGRCDRNTIAFLPGVNVYTESEQIGNVFYRKPMYITRHF